MTINRHFSRRSLSTKGRQEQTMNETIIILIWGIALLSISWTAIKTFKESNDESAIIKVVALVLTIAFAPLLALLQGVWAIK